MKRHGVVNLGPDAMFGQEGAHAVPVWNPDDELVGEMWQYPAVLRQRDERRQPMPLEQAAIAFRVLPAALPSTSKGAEASPSARPPGWRRGGKSPRPALVEVARLRAMNS